MCVVCQRHISDTVLVCSSFGMPQDFLAEMSQYFEIVIFTDEPNSYADPVLNRLDANHVIPYRLYRPETQYHQGKHVRDLSKLNRDLSQVGGLNTGGGVPDWPSVGYGSFAMIAWIRIYGNNPSCGPSQAISCRCLDANDVVLRNAAVQAQDLIAPAVYAKYVWPMS